REIDQARELRVHDASRGVSEDLAPCAEIESVVQETAVVAIPNSRIETVQEAVVGADEDDLAPFVVAARELAVGASVIRDSVEQFSARGAGPRRQIRRQVLEVPGRIELQRLGVEDVAELVTVTGRVGSSIGADLRRR